MIRYPANVPRRTAKPGYVLASGGLDSTTLAYLLRTKRLLRGLIFFDYGQATAGHRTRFLRRVSRALKVPLIVENGFRFPEEKTEGHPLFVRGFRPGRQPDPMPRKYLLKRWGFIEGRNLVFLAQAAIRSVHEGLSTLYTGFQELGEWRRGRLLPLDNGAAFVEDFNCLCLSAFAREIEFSAPFMWKDKLWIARKAASLGVPIEGTHSCEHDPACGECLACKQRRDALDRIGLFR